jgi:hypothetical protein
MHNHRIRPSLDGLDLEDSFILLARLPTGKAIQLFGEQLIGSGNIVAIRSTQIFPLRPNIVPIGVVRRIPLEEHLIGETRSRIDLLIQWRICIQTRTTEHKRDGPQNKKVRPATT